MCAMKQIVHVEIQNILSNSYTSQNDIKEFVFNSKNTYAFRVLWMIIIIICSSTCCYQIRDRICYYLTNPLAIDINISEPKLIRVLKIALVAPDTYAVNKTPSWEGQSPFNSIFPYGQLLGSEDIDTDKLWKIDPQDKLGMHIKIYHNNQNVVEMVNKNSIFYDMTVLGQVVSYDFSKQNIQNILITPNVDNSLVAINEDTQGRLFFALNGNFFTTLQFRHYIHIPTSLKPCVKENLYIECFVNCRTKTINDSIPCRLPIHDKSFTKVPCNKTNEKKSFMTSFKTVVYPPVEDKCKCITSCTVTTTILNPAMQTTYDNATRAFSLNIDQTDVTLIERKAYDLISLLADIGGNIGLFTGLTLLSVINILYATFYDKQSYAKSTSKLCSKIKLKTRKTYHKLQQSNKIQTNNHSVNYILFRNLKIAIWAICFCFVTFMIQQRLFYYLQYPIRLVVETSSSNNISIPSLTICASSAKLKFKKSKFARENNIDSWCEVDIFDLINFKKQFSFQTIWKDSAPVYIALGESALKVAFDMKSLTANWSTIDTHVGKCSHFRFNDQKYLGIFTTYITSFQTGPMDNCTKLPFSFFTDSPHSTSYNILTNVDIPPESYIIVDYRYKTITRLNTKKKICSDENATNKCKHDCFMKQLEKAKNICHLPFIPKSITSIPCNSSSAAKKTRQKFVNILVQASVGTVCHCTQPCSERVLNKQVIPFPKLKPDPYLGFIHVVTNNIVEKISEVTNYSLISLICDTGNVFGMILGLSLLTIVDYSIHSVTVLRKITKSI